ncbi:MAG: helix-turn-helix transcriptional regulator, partial [Bacteroidota bacterium]
KKVLVVSRFFFEKWEGNDSPYLVEFRQEYSWDFAESEKEDKLYIYFILGLLVGLPIWPVIQFFRKKQSENLSYRLNELSIQERKIFALIQAGKSNKEISEALHIEPTTVKSHLRNVYGKLNISSRKEALNFPAIK